MSQADLQATVQRQAETIEALHAATAQYKARADAAEQFASGRLSEADALRSLTHENANLRGEAFALTERVRDLEAAISRGAEATSLTAESQAQLGVQVRAYQRHNHFLQGELSSRDAKMRAFEERIEFLLEEVKTKDRRLAMMMDRLRKHNVDVARLQEQEAQLGGDYSSGSTTTSSFPARITVPEATLQQIRERMAVQNSTVEVLRERLEALEDEAARKEHVLASLRRENDALKGTISRMVAQISVEVQASTAELQNTADSMMMGMSAAPAAGPSSMSLLGSSPSGGGGGNINRRTGSNGNNSGTGSDAYGTGSSLLLGLGGAATGHPAIAAGGAHHHRYVESPDDMEARIKNFRSRRLQDMSGGSSNGSRSKS